jgi:PAS domain S-box-containing protein
MRIKAKILWGLLGMCLVVGLVGGHAINRQRAVGTLEATSEAEEDARVLAAIVAADHDPAHVLSEKIARYIHQTGREVEVVDRHQFIIAAAMPSEVGSITNHGGDALTQTLHDGRVRTFLESSAGHPSGMRLIVVPMTDDSGQVVGAVTEEYTPIYDEFMAITEATTRQVVIAALAGVVIAVLLSLYIGTSIGRPLGQLTRAAAGFASGQTGLPMPAPRNDEIGDLAAAFNVMIQKRQEAEEAQKEAGAELARANEQLQREVSERRLAEETARQGEERVRQLADDLARERGRLAGILDGVPAVVFELWSLEDMRRNFVSNHVEAMYGYTPEEWASTPDFWTGRIHPEDRERVLTRVSSDLAGDNGSGKRIFRWMTKDNRVIWGETSITVIRDPTDGSVGVRGFTVDITEQKRAEQELANLHQKLVDASRAAGMAEVATSVLHNVGNVLNSVNISATIAADHIRQSSASHLGRIAGLLGDNAENLGSYLTVDPTGRKLPGFIGLLAEQLDAEHATILSELGQLGKNVEHIKDIVATQQNYASTAGMSQTVAIVDLVEDCLRMNAGALTRHEVRLVREYEAEPVIQVDKHKVMQILVNLIRNAKYSCDESSRTEKRLTMRIHADERIVSISVIDNGVGIPAENLTRIFSHGFTTRKEGHGFGLHSGALAALEIGGALLVHSDGPGHGATFTLELPLNPLHS